MANPVLMPPEINPGHEAPKLRPGDAPQWNKETGGSMWSSLASNLRDAFSADKQPPLQLESKPVESDLMLHEEGVFASLLSSVRDVFFPAKLPPLVLESTPIAVVDRMAVKRDPKSTAVAFVLHVAVIALILWVVSKKIVNFAAPVQKVVIVEVPPVKAPPKAQTMGGGGGQRGPTPVSKGSPPKFADQQIVPPKAPPLEDPKIKIQPTIEVQKDVKMASSLPNIGMPNGPAVSTSMGNGSGTGLGSGNGSGMGPGSGGNTGGGPRRIGGGVSAPVILYQPEPEFSEEARKAKLSGNVMVYLQVNEAGIPTHVRVLHALGMGLDEKAMEAVRQYRFKPAMENGKPVTVEMQVEVDFQMF